MTHVTSAKLVQRLVCFIPALTCILVGCDSGGGEAVSEAVFVCTESLEVFRLPVQSPPPVHPKTGRATLAPGLYCSKCDKWYPAPPLEAVGGNAGAITCPVHRDALSSTGPIRQPTPIEEQP